MWGVINLLYDTVYVYFSIVNVLNRLSETVKFSCFTQFKLVEDMENKWAEMERIVREETGI